MIVGLAGLGSFRLRSMLNERNGRGLFGLHQLVADELEEVADMLGSVLLSMGGVDGTEEHGIGPGALEDADMPPTPDDGVVLRSADDLYRRADVGIQGMTISLPDVHDLEVMEMTGRALGPVFAGSAA